jgi:hypothetical protein
MPTDGKSCTIKGTAPSSGDEHGRCGDTSVVRSGTLATRLDSEGQRSREMGGTEKVA